MTSGDALTGRDAELAAVRRALSRSGRFRGVAIVGEPGVGKTRLAREALRRAAAGGERTAWIVGTESARVLPLGAFAAVLSDDVTELLPNIRALIKSFVAQQNQRQTVIGVDDAHLLDGLSAHVVHHLARVPGVRLVVTVRGGGTEPDAVTALWKEGLLARLDLAPLSLAATRELVERTLDGPVDSPSVQRFWKLSGGNALYLRQLLADQRAAGRLRNVAGVWIWDEAVAFSLSSTDMVQRQLGRLTPGAGDVVDLLSQCEPLGVDVLADLAGREAVAEAERARLITVERDGRQLSARLAHPLVGEVRRATAGELYLSGVRGRLARRLAADGDRDLRDTVRRALLTLESDLDPDPDLYLRAARAVMTLLDLRLAERFAAAAAECGSTEAGGLRAMNTVLLGRGAEADPLLAALADGGPQARMWATVRAANLVWMLGDVRRAEAVLAGLAAGQADPADTAMRLAVEAGVDAVRARCRDAAEKARTALAFDGLPDFHAMLAAIALTMALGALGEPDGLPELAETAQARAATSFQASHMRFWYGAVHARACRLTGRLQECVTWADRLSAAAADVPGPAYANLAMLVGVADLVAGRLPRGVQLLREALAGAHRHLVTTGLRPAACFALAEAYAKLGRPEPAAEVLAEAQRCVPADYLFMHTALAVATGWTLAAGGELAEAISVVRREAEAARERSQPTHELACLQVATQWGDTETADRATDLAAQLRLPLADLVARYATALRGSDGEGLLAAAADFRELGDPATAADAAAQAALAFSAAQRGNRARYAATLAAQYADECGGLCTPALRNPVTPVPLTGRQREIAELVAAGLSNREIAEKLKTSVRTVEGHVFRACKRVGVDTRAELAAIMRAGSARTPTVSGRR